LSGSEKCAWLFEFLCGNGCGVFEHNRIFLLASDRHVVFGNWLPRGIADIRKHGPLGCGRLDASTLGQCRERGRRLAAEEGLSCGKLCYYVLVADAKSPQRALWLQGLMSVELGVRLG
jgi:hypothetical protein